MVTSRNAHINKYALACALLASTNSVLLGYDIGVMSGAVLFIRDNLKISSTKVEILVGSLNVCSLIGSFASGKTSDWIGRRYTIVLAAITFFVGALVMGFATNFGYLMAGRVVAGIGVGYSLMIAPVYTAELSPVMTRGLLTSLPEVFITLGILLGYIVNYALSGLPEHINWRLMVGLAAVPAVGIAVGVLFMPESPRWLVMKRRMDEAQKVLKRTSHSDEEAHLRLVEISKAALAVTTCDTRADNWSGQGVWKELLRPSPALRRVLVAAIGINFFMQASGNDAVVYYTPEVFKAAGIQQRKHLVGVTIIMGLTKTSFVLVSAFFLDKFGRRPLLLLGSIGMAVSLAGLGLGSRFLEHSSHKPTWAIALCVVAVCADVSFFSIGLGPITWVYTSEIFPMRLRAQGSSLAVSVNRLVSGVVSMTFLTISSKITFGGMFFVLSGVMTVATVFFYFFLPETKGKSLEEMGALFEKKDTEGDRLVEGRDRLQVQVADGDRYTVNYREAYGIFACNGILFNHESPRRGENFVTRKITRAVGRIKIGLQSKLFLGNLQASRDWGFAGDYVEAMWLMLQREKPDDYVVATEESHTVEEFLEKAFGYVGLNWKDHVEIDKKYFRPSEVDNLKGDSTKARKVLGWKPKVGFEQLVKMMVDEDIELAKREKVLVDAGYMDAQQQP
ncbi:hypothetical protein E3N88_46203 [Mikania micrantha]|uniref:Major facilitator superfamily (MFS) profile domain-containing protein n=1 Tax=Mikania micrantha TaxID=192012 RepID=A0A5N6L6X7_9ASTR|nr:hypothetical protein E3N88_46203 [Mikania micrantha]